jgi:pimeloyl-ACP methyl ester carboxylesterase
MHSPFIYRFRKLKRGAVAKLAILTRKFDPLLKTDVPLLRMEYRGDAQTDNLVIFLPGIGDLAEDFERSGFVGELQQLGITTDAVAVDAHYGYYASRTIHARITEDVIAWARASGYRNIWLAGISLGGFGAASYAALHASQLSGLLLLAPYLGHGPLIEEIATAGGVAHWQPGVIGEGDHQRALWAWLKNHHSDNEPALPIYLGYGESDMFRRANMLLADLLPRDRVHAIPGKHDWRTWTRLWQTMLPGWNPRPG